MKQSITQELDYGCGVACFAYVCNFTFKEAIAVLGKEYSVKHGWKPSHLVKALADNGHRYKNFYVRKRIPLTYPSGTIVLIERSRNYPAGHYLVHDENIWMDPWVNLPEDGNLEQAKSGFREKLPGNALYALMPSKT